MNSQPRAAILVTGSEILLGRTLDRNSNALARELDRLGIRLERVVAVDDREEHLRAALDELLQGGYDLICTTGGLGPTHDDRTVAIVSAATGRPLVRDPGAYAEIVRILEGYAEQRGVALETLLPGAEKQALIPEGARAISPAGTAPGVIVPGAPLIVILPGPPAELAEVWARALRDPLLEPMIGGDRLDRTVLRIWNTPESTVARTFESLGGDQSGTETSICASRLEVEVVIRTPPAAVAHGQTLVTGLRAALGSAIYAEDPLPIEERVIGLLRERGWTIATGESCTAGLVAARLTDVAGASAVLRGGTVAYANDIKVSALGVPEALLERHGAVSAEVAEALAEGARRTFGADVGVGVTGIAGPGGATPEKPVGLVHLCVVAPDGRLERMERRFPGQRDTVRQLSAAAALHLVRIACAP